MCGNQIRDGMQKTWELTPYSLLNLIGSLILEKIAGKNRENNMMKILGTKQRRETLYRVRIDREDIIAWLRQQNGGIPSNANFWIGHDWA